MDIQKYIQLLRNAADFYEVHPELTQIWFYPYIEVTLDQLKGILPTINNFEKEYTDKVFLIKLDNGLTIQTKRENVCTKKILDIIIVPEKYIAGYVVPSHKEEVIEWECKPVLSILEEEINIEKSLEDIPF